MSRYFFNSLEFDKIGRFAAECFDVLVEFIQKSNLKEDFIQRASAILYKVYQINQVLN